jgi:uncharacterized protein
MMPFMRSTTIRHRLIAVLAAASLISAACSSDDSASEATGVAEADSSEAPGDSLTLEPATFESIPGVLQLGIIGAVPGAEVTIVDAGGADVAEGQVDEAGAFLARNLDPGTYTVITTDADGTAQGSEPQTVLDPADHPGAEFYEAQTLPTEGMGYIEARDGTLLSATTWLPGPADGGPYPTVVEYSGYGPSNPDDSTFAQLFNALGYAYVGVNMRGTGCSGGSYRFFEITQQTDGYDVIEAVAAQPWVTGNAVGMVGISYPGISQLYVAAQQPPSLLAVTPISVIENAYRSTLYPGGILNTGFAVEWTQQRMDQSKPYGQGWEQTQVDAGDDTCADNQTMRLQNPDLVAEIDATPFYKDSLEPELAPNTFIDKIEVPTFIAGAWQDEQTGGRFPAFLDGFTGTDKLFVTLVNGLHTESLSPGVFDRYVEFLDLYVKQAVPTLGVARITAPILAASIWGVGDITLPADRFEGMSYDDALAAFESEPRVKVLFEQGGAEGQVPGSPVPRWTESFDAWPIPQAEAERWYLGTNGALSASASAEETTGEYVADPDALPATFFEGSGSAIWKADVAWNWLPIPDGTGLEFTSAPFAEDAVYIGSGSADLWVSSTTGDTDLEVTVVEVRSDGSEQYVQSGWLRTSHRALLDDETTELLPVHTHQEADNKPLPDGELTLVRLEIFPFAHAFRAGSQLRITIDAPGNARGEWEFDTISGGETVRIGFGGSQASSIALSRVPGLSVPAGYPACGALRGQPCRPG